MTHELGDGPPPLPVLARRLAARIGRNFSETIHILIQLNGDVEAVRRHFRDLEDEEARKAARACRRRRDEGFHAEPPPQQKPLAPEPEPILIIKSESEFAPKVLSYSEHAPNLPPPDNAATIADMISRGILAPATIETGRGARVIFATQYG